MERRKFTREFKLGAVRLIKERGLYPSIDRSGCASVAASRLGEEASGRSAARLPRPGADEAGAARDRTVEARGHQAQGRAGHTKKSRSEFNRSTQRSVRA